MRLSFDVLCLSHLRWDFVRQRPQHLLSRCAQDHRVIFFEEPIVEGECAHVQLREPDPNVLVAVPHLPTTMPHDQYDATLSQLISDLIDRHQIDDYVLWYYTPMSIAHTTHLRPLAVVYDCMDELANFAHASPLLREREELLLCRADLVFAGGPSLYEAKRSRHSSVWCFPSSVDVAHFTRARTGLPDPADQATIRRPRLGYFGVLDERLDWDLLTEIALARPDWQLVLVGPVTKISPAQLPRRANIHYLGMKPYSELPAYIAGWDVALLPFAHNSATRFISPTKTPEYLAAGKPVVSTSVRDVVQLYNDTDLIRIADGGPDVMAAIVAALSDDHRAWLRRVDELLVGMSWDRTWEAMGRLVDQVVADRLQGRSQQSPAAPQVSVESAPQ